MNWRNQSEIRVDMCMFLMSVLYVQTCIELTCFTWKTGMTSTSDTNHEKFGQKEE